MPTLAKLLKEEIVRLSRKEARTQIEPLRKASAAHRRQIAALKRTVAQLQREAAALGRASRKATPTREAQGSTRFVAKGLRTLRERLGLSLGQLGLLAGVSGQTIRNWESKKSAPGEEHRAVLFGLRTIGKREAAARLSAASPKAARPRRGRKAAAKR